jgi:hypothetical protein
MMANGIDFLANHCKLRGLECSAEWVCSPGSIEWGAGNGAFGHGIGIGGVGGVDGFVGSNEWLSGCSGVALGYGYFGNSFSGFW